jgi:hypothetical protein
MTQIVLGYLKPNFGLMQLFEWVYPFLRPKGPFDHRARPIRILPLKVGMGVFALF